MKYQLYIHTPYCKSKCNYCAFFSICTNPNWNLYEKSIIRDLKYWKSQLNSTELETIYFGGGTPTLIPHKNLYNILNFIKSEFEISKNCEISMEANPLSINQNKLEQFHNFGINRLSIGIQSLNNKNLQFLGRKHSASEAITFLNTAKQIFNNISCDFIYGLPNQKISEFKTELEQINELKLQHLSLYELSIEPNTPLFKKNIKPVTSSKGFTLYNLATNTINLPRYEISNFAKPKFECKHNKNIWLGKPYIGVGPASCGRILKNNQWFETFTETNINNWHNYFQTTITPITKKTRSIENIIVGLRTIYGIKLTPDLKQIINFEYIKKNPNFFLTTNNSLTLTNEGKLILDTILLNIIN